MPAVTTDPQPAVPQRARRALQVLLLVAVAGGAVWFVFRDVRWSAFTHELGRVDVPLFAAGLALFAGRQVVRALRWGRLVDEVRPQIRFRSIFAISSIGYFLINVLPFRLGELVRPVLLLEQHEVPLGAGAATVVVERVFDVLALGALLVGVLLWGAAGVEATPLSVYGHEVELVQLGRTGLLALLLPVGIGVAVLLSLGERGVALAGRLGSTLGERAGELAARFLGSFNRAIRSIGSGRAIAVQVGLTATIWTMNVSAMWLMARAFPFGSALGFWDGATILLGVCLVVIVPPPPGFVGVFEGAVAVVLTQLYGESMTTAAAYGVLAHVGMLTVLTALGLYFVAVDRVGLSRLLRVASRLRADQS
jgi:glycosyltransferase 2 family protein